MVVLLSVWWSFVVMVLLIMVKNVTMEIIKMETVARQYVL